MLFCSGGKKVQIGQHGQVCARVGPIFFAILEEVSADGRAISLGGKQQWSSESWVLVVLKFFCRVWREI